MGLSGTLGAQKAEIYYNLLHLLKNLKISEGRKEDLVPLEVLDYLNYPSFYRFTFELTSSKEKTPIYTLKEIK